MFRKVFIAAMFVTAAGYCFAATNLPQVVTSEVIYKEDRTVNEDQYRDIYETQYVENQEKREYVVPAWPLVGSDADTEVVCGVGSVCSDTAKTSDNIKIVSKIGADLVVENNFNLGVRGGSDGWSGGANMLHGNQVPAGFIDECYVQSEMPLMNREMLEDDGGEILSVSRSDRKRCANKYGATTAYTESESMTSKESIHASAEINVDASADAEAPRELQDQVRSWVVASGQTLRVVLQSWCDKEGWDLVWATSREYPIEASAVFKGRFVDVSSALVRNFGRATPTPYAKFYKGNRVLVVSTTEE